jgi:hypothetical protein
VASSAFWKLRRLAPRAIRVVQRRGTESPALAAYSATLVPKAETFISAYDKAGKYEATWRKEMGEGKGAVASVLKTMRAWLPLVQRDVPGFDSSSYGDQPTVPDDVLEDGGRLFDVVHDHLDAAGNPLAYRDAFIADFDGILKEAGKEWSEAEAADKSYQALLAAVRQGAEQFDLELVAFRKTLSSVVGRGDKDFQKLRAERAQAPDEEEDPTAPSPVAPVAPAPPGAAGPTV